MSKVLGSMLVLPCNRILGRRIYVLLHVLFLDHLFEKNQPLDDGRVAQASMKSISFLLRWYESSIILIHLWRSLGVPQLKEVPIKQLYVHIFFEKG
jgi:hypothetical protein